MEVSIVIQSTSRKTTSQNPPKPPSLTRHTRKEEDALQVRRANPNTQTCHLILSPLVIAAPNSDAQCSENLRRPSHHYRKSTKKAAWTTEKPATRVEDQRTSLQLHNQHSRSIENRNISTTAHQHKFGEPPSVRTLQKETKMHTKLTNTTLDACLTGGTDSSDPIR